MRDRANMKAALVATGMLLALALGDDASAQATRARKAKAQAAPSGASVIYRCMDAGGTTLSLQSAPCPRGQRQERSVIAKPLDPVADIAAATANTAPTSNTAPTAAIAPVTPAAAITPQSRLRADDVPAPPPPPPLYLCRTPSAGSYVNETADPPERCRQVPLVNVSNSGSVPEHDGRLQCVMERDHCDRIPDQELCATWKRRLREAGAMLELGNPDLMERATRQRDQAQRVVDRSCLTEP